MVYCYGLLTKIIHGDSDKLELLLEISYQCNYNCIHCSSINCDGKIKINDLNKFESIINDIDIVRISGGEPLLNVDLINYINYFYNRDISIILQTNGSKKIPSNMCDKIDQINLSLYSNEKNHNFITQDPNAFYNCVQKMDRYNNIVLCSPIFSLADSKNVIKIARHYDLKIRFTSLLNHGRCNFAKPLIEQKNIYRQLLKLYNKIVPHCSLLNECNQESKFVIKPNLETMQCAANKQGMNLCKKFIE